MILTTQQVTKNHFIKKSIVQNYKFNNPVKLNAVTMKRPSALLSKTDGSFLVLYKIPSQSIGEKQKHEVLWHSIIV